MAVRRSGVPANSARCCSGSTDSLPCDSAAWLPLHPPARGDAAQDDVDPRDELARAERLGDVVVAADLEAEHAVDLVVARRQEQDRNVGGLSDFAADIQPVEFRHADIEHDQIGPVGGKAGQCFLAVARLEDGHAGLLQCDADDLADVQVVVNDENAVRQGSLREVVLACGRIFRLGVQGALEPPAPKAPAAPGRHLFRCCSTRQPRRETRVGSNPRRAMARSMAGSACGPRENR